MFGTICGTSGAFIHIIGNIFQTFSDFWEMGLQINSDKILKLHIKQTISKFEKHKLIFFIPLLLIQSNQTANPQNSQKVECFVNGSSQTHH